MKAKPFLLSFIVFFSPLLLFGQFLNWETLNTGTEKNINDIYFLSADTGYIVGDDYLFKKTTDGGLTWFDLPAPSIAERPNNGGDIIAIEYYEPISPISEIDGGLILLWEHPVYPVITSDDGASYLPLEQFYSSVCSANGFAVFNPGDFIGYTDLTMFGKYCNGGGVISTFSDGPFSVAYTDTSYYGNGEGYSAMDLGAGQFIAGHSDGNLILFDDIVFAVNTDTVHLDTSGVAALAYAGNSTWYAATNRDFYNMYKSIDGGATFQIDSTFYPSFFYPKINDMDFLPNGLGLAGALSNQEFGVIIVKIGTFWDFYSTEYPINSVLAMGNGTAFAAGDSGLVMKTDGLVSVDEITNSQRKINIYPNPANDHLTVEISSGLKVNRIRIIDVLGTTVRKFAGTESRLDIKGLRRGTYIALFTIDGTILSKKFVVDR